MKNILFGAAATLALHLAASGPALAGETHPCLDADCAMTALIADPADVGDGQTTAPKYGAWGLDLAGRDASVKPGDNFYRYANGTWDDHAAIPADRARYGNFDKLSALSENLSLIHI